MSWQQLGRSHSRMSYRRSRGIELVYLLSLLVVGVGNLVEAEVLREECWPKFGSCEDYILRWEMPK